MKRFGCLALLLLGIDRLRTAPRDRNMIQPESRPSTASLPDLGPAPELTNDTWLNADAPLRLADLRGKVVAIDMWTFG